MREQVIDRQDVQGLVRGYGRSLPVGRFLLLTIRDADAFRDFLRWLRAPTNMEEWPAAGCPDTATNIAFTYQGLEALALPPTLLESFPAEFKQGMRRRSEINADIGSSDPRHWDPCWLNDSVHVWLGVYAKSLPALETRIAAIVGMQGAPFSIADQQPVGVIKAPPSESYADGTLLEHFGFADALSEPAIEGVAHPATYAGSKKPWEYPRSGWLPLAPGEFLLGHYKDEADERPVGPAMLELATNSTFMVYRKLSQDVKGFWEDIDDKAKRLGICAINLAERMVGRRLGGALLVGTKGAAAAIPANRRARQQFFNDFDFSDDADGRQCPLGAHIRRANPRATFGFGTVLVDRHRILRRGIPYGPFAENPRNADPQHERGLIFIALNASISRQFEFVQRRWLNDGHTFNVGNDRDPLVGSHPSGNGRFVLNEPRNGVDAPAICPGLTSHVTVKGGDYFFLPGLGALRYLAEGSYHL